MRHSALPVRPILLLLLLLPAGCALTLDPDETPWCLQAVPLPGGRLYPNGVWERKPPARPRRLYLPSVREGRRIGLALARLPKGEIRVCDVVPGGPAARAGFRPGQLLRARGAELEELLARMARGPGTWTVREGKKTKTLFLRPVENLTGRTEIRIPPLLSFSGDDSFLEVGLALSFFSFSTRWEETGPGRLSRKVRFAFFWGLLSF